MISALLLYLFPVEDTQKCAFEVPPTLILPLKGEGDLKGAHTKWKRTIFLRIRLDGLQPIV
jgi:hypothetical protein